jgi:uncharacterized protein
MHNALETLRLTYEALVELFPYFVAALIIGASVNLLCLDVLAKRSFRKHGILGIIFTTCLGAFSPFCSFTVIPLIRRLLLGGVPLSAVMAFWLSSPAIDPPIFLLTAKQMGVPLALARLIGAIVLSAGTGFIVYVLERRGYFTDVVRKPKSASSIAAQSPVPAAAVVVAPAHAMPVPAVVLAEPVPSELGMSTAATLVEERVEVVGASSSCATTAPSCGDVTSAPSCGSSGGCGSDEIVDDGSPWWDMAKRTARDREVWRKILKSLLRDFVNLGKWLVFACFFTGLIGVYVPTHAVTSVLGGSGLLAIPLAVLISVPLYLNGVGAIPIVGGLLAKGMAHGAAISFLLGGAVTTIPAMVAVRSVVNNRTFAVYLTAGAVGSVLIGSVVQILGV